MPVTDKRPLKVFLCHAHADRDPVRGLYTRLTQDGVDAWLDKAKLLPGQDWELEIRKAVREADVVVVCLSKQFNQAGFRQKEVRLALDTAMEKPEGEIFIIPARLEECENLESLRRWHWVDLFEGDGYEMLTRAMQTRAEKIGAFVTRNEPDKKNNEAKGNLESKKQIQNTGSRKIGVGLLVFMLLVFIIYLGYQYPFSSLENNNITPTSFINTVPSLGETLIVTTPASLPLPPISKVVASTLPDPATCPKWLLFHSFREDNLDIFRLDGVEGTSNSSVISLSQNDAVDARPSRSPNGSMVVFQSNRTGNVEIYLVDSLGKEQTRLTNTGTNNTSPMFGSDNKSVVYNSDRNGTLDIYLLNIESGKESRLTFDVGDDINPYWSPDLDWIVFQSNRSGFWRVYLLNVSTGKEYQIDDLYSRNLFSNVDTDGFDLIFPSWSPDGEHLAFLYSVSGSLTLVISDLQGRILYTGPTYTGSNLNYEWAPDGSRIAYQKEVDSNMDIYVYDFTSNIEYRLTDYVGNDSGPSWDCSGTNIAYTSIRDGNPDIFSIPWQGGKIIRVTNNTATDKWVLWSGAKNLSSMGY